MNKNETIALYQRALAAHEENPGSGAKVWNAWAEGLIRERMEIEGRGDWHLPSAEEDWTSEHSAAKSWMERATVDFSRYPLQDAKFSEFVFPYEANFDGTSFVGMADFVGADFRGPAAFDGSTFHEAFFFEASFSENATFRNASFREPATFISSTFRGPARFDDCQFFAAARFVEGKFTSSVSFVSTKFEEDAWYRGCMFLGECQFFNAKFSGNVTFDNARFEGRVVFDEVMFLGQANFHSAVFIADSSFKECEFTGHAAFDFAFFGRAPDFEALSSLSAFTVAGAEFRDVPNFIQSEFSQPPRFDNSVITRTGRSKHGSADGVVVESRSARFRALKGLAIRGNDHDAEQRFFAEEIKARFGVEDFALPRPQNIFRAWKVPSVAVTDDELSLENIKRKLVWVWEKGEWIERAKLWPGGARYWLGSLYQLTSDFGRSFARPLILWLITTLTFALIYVSVHISTVANHPQLIKSDAYIYRTWASPLLATTYTFTFGILGDRVSLHCVPSSNSIADLDNDPWDAAIYIAIRRSLIISPNDDHDKLGYAYACLYGDYRTNVRDMGASLPKVTYWIAALGILQSVLAGIFIFLILLAIRNQFRIK